MEASGRVPIAGVSDMIAQGRPLPFKVLDGAGRLLLAAGHVIHDVRQLESLLERGACVEYAEAERVRRERASPAHAGGSLVPSARTQTWFDRFERQVWTLDRLLRDLGKGVPVAEGLQAFGEEFIALVGRQPDAALFLAVRQDEGRSSLYALTHALNTATVSMLAARQLGWPDAHMHRAVLAALTMNAAIVDLQGRMAEQKSPPTKAQIDMLRAHPHRAAELLGAAGIADDEWLTAVRDHHERTGEGGYPRGGIEPGELARLLRAADVFTAKISPRQVRLALAPQVAARQLFQQEGGGPIAAALIKAVGVYPPGDIVQLKSGETAIVVARTAAGNAPQVAVLLSAQGKAAAGTTRHDTDVAEHAIVGPMSDRSRVGRVLPEAVYGLLD